MNMKDPQQARCGVRVKTCPVARGGCGYRYTKDDRELWSCPRCGFDRHCTVPVGAEGDRCNVHGGKSQRATGLAAPATRTGEFSRDLPTRLAAGYERAMSDPELMSLRSGISLLDHRVWELVGRLDEGGGEAQLKRIETAHKELTEARNKVDGAINSRNTDRLAESLDELRNSVDNLGDAITEARRDYGLWRDIQATLESQRRLKDSERKRLVDMQLMMGPDQGMLMIGTIEAIFKRVVGRVLPVNLARAVMTEFAKELRDTFGI